MSASNLDAHLASCSDCARWIAAAERATRLMRLDVTPVPDLADRITEHVALPARRVARFRLTLRAALVVVGVVQVVVGLPAALGDSIGMAMSMHGAHESAAWNLAVGVAFLAAALVPRRSAGLIPLLGTFLVVLTALSVRDVAAHAVTAPRLATHVAALVGLLLLVALDRSEQALPPGRAASARRRQHKSDEGDTDLRTVA